MNEAQQAAFGVAAGLVARFVTDADLAGTLGWLARRCVDRPRVGGSALLVANRQGVLDVIAASSDQARQLQELELHRADGPARDCFTHATRVDCDDLLTAGSRWPRFAAAAHHQDVRAVHAFPLRMPTRAIGVLTVFLDTPGGLPDDELEALQLLADTAALGVESHHSAHHSVRADQLQTALDSRVRIEQAKGLLAERLGLDLGDAFTLLRQHARNNGLRLSDVAGSIVDGTLQLRADRQRSRRRAD